MKKIVTVVVVIAAIFSLAACSANVQEPAQVADTAEEAAAEEASVSEEALSSDIGSSDDPFAKYDITPNEEYKIVFANFADTNTFATFIMNSFKDACDYYGVEMTSVDNNMDGVQAVNNANTAITMGADFYVQFNIDAAVNARVGGMLADAGIPSMALQVPMAKGENSEEFAPFFGLKNKDCGYLAGEAGAQKAIELWGEDANISMLTIGIAGLQMHQDRMDGGAEGAKSVIPDIEVEEVYTSKNESTEFAQKTTDYLTAHPDSKVLVWAPNDMTGLAQIQAIKLAGRESDVIYVSAQYDMAMEDYLLADNSVVYGCVDTIPDSWGWMVVPEIIESLNNGTEMPAVGHSYNILLTKENYSEYYN